MTSIETFTTNREIRGIKLELIKEINGPCIGCYFKENNLKCDMLWCEIPFAGNGIFIENNNYHGLSLPLILQDSIKCGECNGEVDQDECGNCKICGKPVCYRCQVPYNGFSRIKYPLHICCRYYDNNYTVKFK